VTKKSWKLFGLLVCGAAVILCFIQINWMAGYLLGCLGSVLVYMNTSHYADRTISAGIPAGSAFHFTLNFLIWTISLILCAYLPKYLNILACAAGLFMIRTVLVITELKR
jgi:hypothetical protein